ncbi:hypothetical protein EXU57_16320 [Segetibacter sp. 3557_3]|uniref:hypothetical protein n=1 Tax=Segetibacter sp. 3557_3 TaxID=2547429 RepID=UPI0010588869|nr:hypothetical protein [Segetibacter sp. 3557_3]TDH24046.1 hypothetical protein EXU57_16320 [Segetibacter sp. 3557_3]
MEPEALNFLKRIGKSLGIGLVWLCITVTAALKNDNAFPDNGIRLANVLFYLWLVVSVIIMVRIFQKLWTADDIEQE